MTDTREVLMALKELLDNSELITKAPADHNTAPLLHGNGGLFSNSLERDVITAHVRPYGIGDHLPLLPSTTEDPRFGSITGFTDVIGAEPTKACADAPSGFLKGCNLTARFGLLRRDTNTIEFDKVMLKKNRGDLTDLVLRGRLLGMANLAPASLNEAGVLDILTKSEMVGAGVQSERKLVKDMWQGTIANGTFPGLDSQIATGQMDADTRVLCPALDSDIKDFNYDNVCGSGRDIVEYLSMLEFYLRTNAVTMGLDPAAWVIAMRPELWFELSACWPCRYLSNRCSITSGTGVSVINDNVNVNMRDAMRNGLYIDINGNRYPVVPDVGIYERNSTNDANLKPGEYASSIYMVPLTIQGNFPVTYREYLDYRDPIANQNVALLHNMETFWTDDGIYSWYIEQDKWCYKLGLKTEQRVVLRTPQLAGKIQKVKYTPLQHLRDADPQSPYFKDGGVSVRGSSWGSAVWDGRQ